MEACPDAAADWGLVANWFKYWKGQGEMKVYQEAYKNFSQNYQTIANDANKVSGDFSSQSHLLLENPTTLAALTRPIIADILAGFVDGFT